MGREGYISNTSCPPDLCVVLLSNRDGATIHHRGDDSNACESEHWGGWVGGVWSEQSCGAVLPATIAEILLRQASHHHSQKYAEYAQRGARGDCYRKSQNSDRNH